MMLSEGSIPEHHMSAFDITYSWNIYDQLLPILSGKRPATTVDQLLRNEYLAFPTGALRLRFTTNHDKNAWDSPAVLQVRSGRVESGDGPCEYASRGSPHLQRGRGSE